MSDSPCGPYSIAFCKFIFGFISLSYNIMMNQLDFVSRHFATAFNIPPHNIGIYFNKLYSLRTLSFVITGFLENCIFQAAGGDREPEKSIPVRRYVGLFAFSLFLFIRMVYLFILYTSSHLSYHVYIILVFEALGYGFHDAGFMALGSAYMSIVSGFYSMCRLFVVGCQSIIDLIWYSRPLTMIRIQAWIAVLFTTVAVGLWYYYNLYIKGDHPGHSAEEIVDIVEEHSETPLDKLFEQLFPEYYRELQERRKSIQGKQEYIKLKEKVEKEKNSEKENSGEAHNSGNGGNSDSRSENSDSESKKEAEAISYYAKFCDSRIGTDGIGAALSPVMLYWVSTMSKDFLFPATLPYALLHRDKCHMINMLMPIFSNMGPILNFILDNFTPYLKCWSWYYDLFWILAIPLPVIFTCVFMAMFSQKPSARAIINSKPRVLALTIMLMLAFGFMEPLSYVGVGKYAARDNPGGFTLLGFHINAAFLGRSFFSRISVGFSDTRISLGYHLPKFRPTHKMSKSNLRWFLFKQTFKRAWKDVKGDFKLNIRQYL